MINTTYSDKRHEEIFSDDVCSEIISMIDNSWFILVNCSLISKQWFNVIKERSKLFIDFKTTITEKRIDLFMKSQFINSIDSVKVYHYLVQSSGQVKCFSEMKYLRSLNISHNQIGVEGAKFISGIIHLTALNVCSNEIGAEGAKFISEMQHLRSLNISHNQIGDEGVKCLSEMKQLTFLNIYYNGVGDEGAKCLREMKQLTLLDIGSNEIGDEGAKFISEMQQLKSLDISYNEIGDEGAKYIHEMPISVTFKKSE